MIAIHLGFLYAIVFVIICYWFLYLAYPIAHEVIYIILCKRTLNNIRNKYPNHKWKIYKDKNYSSYIYAKCICGEKTNTKYYSSVDHISTTDSCNEFIMNKALE